MSAGREVAPRAKSLLGLVGVVLLAVGLGISIDVRSATPVLIVGGVLAALGLFPWRELRASYGGLEVVARLAEQATADAVETLEEVAASEELPQPVRDQANRRAQELASSLASNVFSTRPRSTVTPTDRGTVLIGLSNVPVYPLSPWQCDVIAPDGSRYSAIATRQDYAPFLGHHVSFPNDFAGVPVPPAEGLYRYEWLSGHGVLTTILPGLPRGRPIASGGFSFPREPRSTEPATEVREPE